LSATLDHAADELGRVRGKPVLRRALLALLQRLEDE